MKRLISACCAAGVMLWAASAQAHTYTLRFFDVDDEMVAALSNSAHIDQQVLQEGFGPSYSAVDISPYVTDGLNTLNLSLYNESPGAGYTYGFDFQVDGTTYASGQCGMFNTYGCNANDTAQGLVWTDQIKFIGTDSSGSPTPAAPEPSTWALMLAGVSVAGLALRSRKRMSLISA